MKSGKTAIILAVLCSLVSSPALCESKRLTELLGEDQELSNERIDLTHFSTGVTSDGTIEPTVTATISSTDAETVLNFVLDVPHVVSKVSYSQFSVSFDLTATASIDSVRVAMEEEVVGAARMSCSAFIDDVGNWYSIEAYSGVRSANTRNRLPFALLQDVNEAQIHMGCIVEVLEEGGVASLSSVSLTFESLKDGEPNPAEGDFDFNGQLEIDDLSYLADQIESPFFYERFDLNADSSIDWADVLFWVSEFKGTLVGDADLSGVVDFNDFLAVSASFGRESTWAEGDFNGDGITQFPDFLILSMNFGSAGTVQNVPEPSSWFGYSTAALFAILLRPTGNALPED